MFRRIDESPFLNRIVPKISSTVSRNSGVPIIVGILFVIVAFVLELANVLIDNTTLEMIRIILHYMGILSALIGFLVVKPLS